MFDHLDTSRFIYSEVTVCDRDPESICQIGLGAFGGGGRGSHHPDGCHDGHPFAASSA